MLDRLALISSRRRVVLAVALGALAFLAATPTGLHLVTRLVLAWNVTVWSWFALIVAMMNQLSAEATRARSQSREAQGDWTLAATLAATVASVAALAYMVIQPPPGWSRLGPDARMTLSLAAVCASWTLIHTKFALHYARLYYSTNAAHAGYANGFLFPGGHALDYWDFMYFSLTIAMTAATSDVSVTTAPMRRLVLLHAVIAFVFYTVILGLVLNAVSTLI